MSESKIIRTVAELEALDPDTAVTLYEWDSSIWSARQLQEMSARETDLPAVVIATGEHVRAAREAIGEERDE